MLDLAEAWEFKVDDSLSPENAWKLVLGTLVSFHPEAALELGRRLKGARA